MNVSNSGKRLHQQGHHKKKLSGKPVNKAFQRCGVYSISLHPVLDLNRIGFQQPTAPCVGLAASGIKQEPAAVPYSLSLLVDDGIGIGVQVHGPGAGLPGFCRYPGKAA